MVATLRPLYDWLERHLLARFPGDCLLCQLPSDRQRLLCSSCKNALPSPEPSCPRCGLPGPQEQLCGRCLRQPPPWDALVSLGDYIDPWRRLITELKFHRRWSHADLLGRLLAERIARSAFEWPDLLLPVPLSAKRHAQRGYNQAALLSQTLGHQLGLPVAANGFMRLRHTPAQSGLKLTERENNLAQAFALRQAPDPQLFPHVAIVDDVVTSGATVSALCRLLKQQANYRVTVFCICRTRLHDDD